jgi:MoaA/NifB/PqqE/SkfB family radical SAM enzyme
LGGGEPLLQKGLAEFLDYMDHDKISVMVTTNLSIDITNNPIYQKLKNWKRVDWMISFDNANKDKFEYVRHGASWEMFTQNIKQLKADNQRVQAHPAYSIYCALDIMEYYDFCVDNKIDLFWCELNHPEHLDIRRAPLALRELAIAEIDRVVEKYKGTRGLAIDILENYRKTLVDNSYLRRISMPVNTVTWHNKIEKELGKTNKFTDLWPVLAEYYK